MNKELSILLVDEDDRDYNHIKDALQQTNYPTPRLEWVKTYEDGVRKIEAFEHDLYLIADNLQNKSGLDLVTRAREAKIEKPIVIICEHESSAVKNQAFAIGASSSILKKQLNGETLDNLLDLDHQHASDYLRARYPTSELAPYISDNCFSLVENYFKLKKVEQIAKIGYWEWNAISKKIHLSPELLFLIGIKTNQAFLSLDQFFQYIYPEDQEKFSVAFQSILSEHKGQLEKPYSFDFRLMPGSTGLRYFHNIIGFTTLSPCGELASISGIMQEVSDQIHRIDYLKRNLEKEKELNSLKSRFVSLASHEFRTPLATILSSLSLAQRYNSPNQANLRQKHFLRIRSNVQYMTSLLDDFLSLSKLEEGKVCLNFENVNIQQFMQDVCTEMQQNKKKGQQILVHFQGEQEEIVSDPKLLKSSLSNLLSNAIKYSPEDSEIQLVTLLFDNQITIEIKDNGIGIPENELDRLFERYFRASNAKAIQGTGLGLNIVKRYVEMMGGSINVSSKENKGTTFKIILPLLKESS